VELFVGSKPPSCKVADLESGLNKFDARSEPCALQVEGADFFESWLRPRRTQDPLTTWRSDDARRMAATASIGEPPGINVWQLSKEGVSLNPGLTFWLRGTFRVPRGRTQVQILVVASMRDASPIDKVLTVSLKET
jgi:hypothetical protein